MNMTSVNLIVAYTSNMVIGKDNDMPWHLPGDLANFKKTTLGCPIIMGRKTWESLGRPLPGRRNIVITRNADYQATGGECVSTLEEGVAAAGKDNPENIFIIGGEQIFRLGLAVANKVYATEIHARIDGDTFFPALNKDEWKESSRQAQPAEKGLEYDFVVYEKS